MRLETSMAFFIGGSVGTIVGWKYAKKNAELKAQEKIEAIENKYKRKEKNKKNKKDKKKKEDKPKAKENKETSNNDAAYKSSLGNYSDYSKIIHENRYVSAPVKESRYAYLTKEEYDALVLTNKDYDTEELHYYSQDKVLTDETYEPIIEESLYLGDVIIDDKFDELFDNDSHIYVADNEMKTVYVITRNPSAFFSNEITLELDEDIEDVAD